MAGEDVLKRIDLTDNEYTVKQKLMRNKYRVFDARGNHILSAKQKLFKMKEEFPFTDPDGNPVFTIKAQKVMDIAGDYAITDAETGNTIAILSKDFSFLTHQWRIKDPETNEPVIRIQSRSKLFGLLRSVSDLANFIPHKYTIETMNGDVIGQIKGKFSIGDTYEITVEKGTSYPKEAIVAAAIAVDALEGN